jgi:hypothetical protein
MLSPEVHMSRVRLSFAAVFLTVAAPLFAQTTVTGDWDVTITSPQGSNTVRVTMKQDGEKVSGVFKSPQGELPFDGGTLTGNDLKFSFSIPFQGTPLQITLTGKVVDNASVSGKADFGGFAEGDWSAKRATGPAPAMAAAPAAAAAAPAPAPSAATVSPSSSTGVSGKWDVTLKTQMGDFPASANLTDAAGKISGTFETAQVGTLDVTGTFDGNVLKLAFTAKTPNGDIPVTLSGDVSGDAISGKADFGGMGAGEWSAKRAKP